METKNIHLGSVRLGKTILASDPCYKPGKWCALEIDGVKPGIWNAFASISDEGPWGERVSALRIAHAEYNGEDIDEELGDGAGVDSGQCGFWDAKKYVKAYKDGGDDFYDRVCNLTSADSKAGLFENWGVVSRSGYGDGGYPVCAARNKKGEIVALEIVYIDGEENNDE